MKRFWFFLLLVAFLTRLAAAVYWDDRVRSAAFVPGVVPSSLRRPPTSLRRRKSRALRKRLRRRKPRRKTGRSSSATATLIGSSDARWRSDGPIASTKSEVGKSSEPPVIRRCWLRFFGRSAKIRPFSRRVFSAFVSERRTSDSSDFSRSLISDGGRSRRYPASSRRSNRRSFSKAFSFYRKSRF